VIGWPGGGARKDRREEHECTIEGPGYRGAMAAKPGRASKAWPYPYLLACVPAERPLSTLKIEASNICPGNCFERAHPKGRATEEHQGMDGRRSVVFTMWKRWGRWHILHRGGRPGIKRGA